ncbi:hypothetical protein GCM10023213_41290 [Prosthecobacter algae]|uniref:Uncharacterized protein n=1 Tax=Prosthecobacter algae TaxID=1144682 RepID=A0ABP9PPX7_9BACT
MQMLVQKDYLFDGGSCTVGWQGGSPGVWIHHGGGHHLSLAAGQSRGDFAAALHQHPVLGFGPSAYADIAAKASALTLCGNLAFAGGNEVWLPEELGMERQADSGVTFLFPDLTNNECVNICAVDVAPLSTKGEIKGVTLFHGVLTRSRGRI